MRILLISDLHIPTRARIDLLNKIDFKVYDQIIVTGDFVNENVIFTLQAEEPVFHGVYGNMDDWDVRGMLPEKKVLNIFDKKIGIIHGHQAGYGKPELLIQMFEGINILIYGHSHKQENRVINGIITINPGAFCEGKYSVINFKDKINFEIKNYSLW